MNPSKYRPDIDGLRAIAVLSVLFFHLGLESFSGGFVGVDIFFVISGFLITRLIRDEVISTNHFSFYNFYLRRTRRLLPSLVFTSFLCFSFSFLLFSPDHFQRFGGALIYTALSISNFYFWRESGYFDVDSYSKPLLHTWSLGVEEQFYIVWPLLLVFILIKIPRILPLFLLLGGLISFWLNLVFLDQSYLFFLKNLIPISNWFNTEHSPIFFLFPFRVFEFVIGAIMVWLIQYQPTKNYILECLLIIGLTFIAYPILTYSKEIIFPAYNALLPCIGAALIIYSGTANNLGPILSNKISVGIGLISYSLYLIHWPIIVFFQYAIPLELQQNLFDVEWPLWQSKFNFYQQIFVIFSSFFLAYLMHRYIEQPFRKIRYNVTFIIASLFFITLLVFLGLNVFENHGWKFRTHKVSKNLQEFIDSGGGEGAFHTKYYGGINAKTNFISVDSPTIILLGDSHSRMYYQGIFNKFSKDHNIIVFGIIESNPFDIRKNSDQWYKEKIDILKKYNHKIIIFGQRWDFFKYVKKHLGIPKENYNNLADFYSMGLKKFFNRLPLNENDRIIVIGQVPQIVGHDGLINCLMRPHWLKRNKCDSMEITKVDALKYRLNFNKALNKKIKSLSIGPNKDHFIEYFDPFKVLCPDGICIQIKDDKLIYSDEDHLSIYGSQYIIQNLFR